MTETLRVDTDLVQQAAQQAMQQAGQLSSLIDDSEEKDFREDEPETREHVPDELAPYPSGRKQNEAGPEIAP